MQSAPASAAAGGDDSSNSCTACMKSCIASIPAITRFMMLWFFISTFFAHFLFLYYIIFWPSIIQSAPIFLYTILINMWFDYDLASGFIGILFIYQIASTIERRKGSIYTIYSYYICSLLGNLLLFIIQALFYNGFGLEQAKWWYSCGAWPGLFGLLAIEVRYRQSDNRPCCGSCTVPTKFYPFILLILICLMRRFIDPSLILGLAAGYLYAYTEYLQPSAAKLRRIESSSKLDYLTRSGYFVSSDSAESGNGLAAFSFNPQSISSGEWSRNRESNETAANQAAADSRAVFASGSGHRLGSYYDQSGSASAPAASPPAQYISVPIPAQPPAVGIQSNNNNRAAEDARSKRLAAIQSRLQSQSASVSAVQSTSPVANSGIELNSIKIQSPPQQQQPHISTLPLSEQMRAAIKGINPGSVIGGPAVIDDDDIYADNINSISSEGRTNRNSININENTNLLSSTAITSSDYSPPVSALNETSVNRLIGLGYNREQSIDALLNSNNDYMSAVRYLRGSQ